MLNRLCSEGFAHYQQSVRIVEVLEQKGQGLNLTWEVRNGILNHRTSGHPATLEGNVVRLSDKIAYINHDIDDAIRGKIMKEEDYISRIIWRLDYKEKDTLEKMKILDQQMNDYMENILC